VSAEEWAKNMDSEGRILNVDYIKRLIFKGVTYFFYSQQSLWLGSGSFFFPLQTMVMLILVMLCAGP